MIAAETSYTAGGNFLDMEEGVAGQNHLKSRAGRVFGKEVRVRGTPSGAEVASRLCIRCLRMGKVSQCAHMKSFSLFYRRVYVVLGSLDEHRCSRITITGWRLMFI